MKFTELKPSIEKSENTGFEYLTFGCPKCLDVRNKHGFLHTFSLPVSPDDPQHWTLHDRNFEALTLTPSVLDISEPDGCHVHFFITAGEIVMA